MSPWPWTEPGRSSADQPFASFLLGWPHTLCPLSQVFSFLEPKQSTPCSSRQICERFSPLPPRSFRKKNFTRPSGGLEMKETEVQIQEKGGDEEGPGGRANRKAKTSPGGCDWRRHGSFRQRRMSTFLGCVSCVQRGDPAVQLPQ